MLLRTYPEAVSECAASGGRLASPTECDTFENLRLALINKFGPSGAGLKFSLGNMANGLASPCPAISGAVPWQG